CAFSGFCQTLGSSSSRLTSSSRSFFWSYSKKPPQGAHTLLQVFELTLQLADFDGHGARILPERPLHEYRQRVGLVRWKRGNFLESGAPVELQRPDADIAGCRARQRQHLRSRPIEQVDQHGQRDAATPRLGLEIHALELGPAAAVLGRAATDELSVLLDHEEDAVRAGQRLGRIEVVALGRV